MRNNISTMLDEISTEAKFTARFTGRTKFSESVMNAMANIDRAWFIPEELKPFAYDNGPLTIGYGQTISQPYIVALMTDLLDLRKSSVVLELGTGSGYQTAILAQLAKQVYSIERIKELSQGAQKLFNQRGIKNVETRCANGYLGWKEKAPFDAIIVTAAAPFIPQSLMDQLNSPGRMVIPVGLPHMPQELFLVQKDSSGNTTVDSILDVAFVPLVDDKDTPD